MSGAPAAGTSPMAQLRRRTHRELKPDRDPWPGRPVWSGLAVFFLAMAVFGIQRLTGASWLIVIAHVALAVGGASLLLILFSVQITEPTRIRRRQFSMGVVLLAMAGLAMLLAGVAGLVRLIPVNPSDVSLQDWIAIGFFVVLLLMLSLPLLLHLLVSLVEVANALLRVPAVRQRLRRLWKRDRESRDDAAYIHGTAPSEQARLALLNRLTNGPFVEFLAIRPGMRVLEVGSGLGLLAADVAAAAEDLEVVGLERSPEQIAAAVQVPRVSYVQGDAHELPFSEETFDLVYCRYLLEHVADPVRVLSEMRRVVRTGGRVMVQENDISLVRLDPPCPAFEQVWSAFAAHQRQLGGDGLIGRRLFRLFRAARLSQIKLTVQPELHWHGSPGFAGWIENLAGNIRSGRQGLVESGLCSAEQIDCAIGELSALQERDDASLTFVWNRAAAVR